MRRPSDCMTFVNPFLNALKADQTGLWNYCEGYYDPNIDWVAVVTDCGPRGDNYYFDPIAIVSAELLPPYTIVFLQNEADAINNVQETSNWLKSAFILSAIFNGQALIAGPLTGIWHQRRLFNCIPVGSMCIASIFWLAGAVTARIIYLRLSNSFNDDIGLNVEAHMGRQMFTWIWLGVGTSWVATIQWGVASLCCPGGHRKRRIERLLPCLVFH